MRKLGTLRKDTLWKNTLEIEVWKLLVIAFGKYMMSLGPRTLCDGTESRHQHRSSGYPAMASAPQNVLILLSVKCQKAMFLACVL